jgi:GH25 family lysozyme M1 (1,4-beta-N-acetylmuramidase)
VTYLFKPRLTRPESGNQYYNRQPKGYAIGIIAGSPQDAGCDVLANCVGYAASRFNEIIGQSCFVYFQYAPNPKDWIATAKTHGLQTGTEPKLGAVLVWEKHVAIVEEINADGSITTSESGYGCTPAFWTTWRNNSNGDWNGSVFGKFLGFIYQPENNEKKEEEPMKKGIDISYCQTKVDWSKVTAEFVIARAGYGKLASQKDAMFESHYSGAKSRGIPIGAYWYSYAMDEASARAEADACIAVLKGKQFEYPIFYDVEEQKQFALGKTKVSAIIRAFLERLESAGYWVGLYGSYSSLTTYTDEDIRKRYSIWLAHWDVQKSPYTGSYGVWQYSVGNAAGVTGACDLDYSYVDYPAQIKAKGLNGYGKQPKPPEPTPAKKTVTVEMKIDGTTYAGTLTEK